MPNVKKIRLGVALLAWGFSMALYGHAFGFDSSGDIDKAFSYKDLRIDPSEMRNQHLLGKICNETYGYFDEFHVRINGLDFSGQKLWDENIEIKGLGPKQCREFVVSAGTVEIPFQISFDTPVASELPLLKAENLNQPLTLTGVEVVGPLLNGKLCNRSSTDLQDLVIAVFSVNSAKEVVWRAMVNVGDLPAQKCENIAHKVPRKKEIFNEFLFAPVNLSPPEKGADGRINAQLSYRKMNVRNEILSGELCNDTDLPIGNIFLKIFAVDRAGGIDWETTSDVPSIAPRQCQSFKQRLPGENKGPAMWQFRILGHEF
ncbi:MAG: hypothetical protein A2X84_04440 [Desulfuromonadaceae bacterium GWC2_58_13]|nr:MAG: hypothetical protein A2X84_04440 [Desulfuromonadaceae bacterium GWC2_58_13]